jgi:hypothetical protein
VTVLNCKDEPVENAAVAIKKCSDKKVMTVKADYEGKARFDICKGDICSISVTTKIQGSRDPLTGVQDKCDGTEEDYQCTFKLCKN